jgi:CheY-like chemotaxis protein
MSLGQKIARHLPFLRRYARALAGNQQAGDHLVRLTLENIVAHPETLSGEEDLRLALYAEFQKICGTVPAEAVVSMTSREQIAQARLSHIAPKSRQALLLTSLEGFSLQDAAILLSVPQDEAAGLVDQALLEIENQTKTRVLIIEDEPIIAMDIESIVRDLGHDVTGIAVTRAEAVALAHETRPGLVLADIQLADDSSGIDAVKDILAEFAVPVIFITAFPERLLTGERPEPTFLITKPFHRSTVKASIGQALFFNAATVPV